MELRFPCPGLCLAVGVILSLIISTNPFLFIFLLRVTPTANRNSYRVATPYYIYPGLRAKHATLGCVIATPTELLLLVDSMSMYGKSIVDSAHPGVMYGKSIVAGSHPWVMYGKSIVVGSHPWAMYGKSIVVGSHL